MTDSPAVWHAIRVGWKRWTVGYEVASHLHRRGDYPTRRAARQAADALNRDEAREAADVARLRESGVYTFDDRPLDADTRREVERIVATHQARTGLLGLTCDYCGSIMGEWPVVARDELRGTIERVHQGCFGLWLQRVARGGS